jgi:tetratricopeptide (TPR) repeat protein
MSMPREKGRERLQELIDEADDVFSSFTRRIESKPLYEEALKIAQDAQKEPETEYIQGKIDLINGKWLDALEHFDRVTKIDPQSFQAWHNRSFALIELHRYEEAIACDDIALKLNPKYAFAWAHKGFSLS